MRRNIPNIFAIVTLLALSLIGACIAQPPANQSSQQNHGLAQITSPGESSRISFEEAKQNLWQYQSDSMNETGNEKNIYFMLSRDLDEGGNATSWIFGVSGDNGSEFLVNDKSGWTAIENVILPSDQIFLDTIVTPENLLKQNGAAIFSNPSAGISERRDLELQNGVYMLTITSGNSTRNLTFNATTGALIT